MISPNQIGFKEKTRTLDHMFTLKSVIDIHKQMHKKVFAAFIDLKKAFDSIRRIGLFYKLLLNNVPRKIYRIIHSMYTDTQYELNLIMASVLLLYQNGV